MSLDPDKARHLLNRCAAVGSLHVGSLRDMGLDVVGDPGDGDPDHALITGLPEWEEEAIQQRLLAQRLADGLLACSRIVWRR